MNMIAHYKLSPKMRSMIQQAEPNLGRKWVMGTAWTWRRTLWALEARGLVERHEQFGPILSAEGLEVRSSLPAPLVEEQP